MIQEERGSTQSLEDRDEVHGWSQAQPREVQN